MCVQGTVYTLTSQYSVNCVRCVSGPRSEPVSFVHKYTLKLIWGKERRLFVPKPFSPITSVHFTGVKNYIVSPGNKLSTSDFHLNFPVAKFNPRLTTLNFRPRLFASKEKAPDPFRPGA